MIASDIFGTPDCDVHYYLVTIKIGTIECVQVEVSTTEEFSWDEIEAKAIDKLLHCLSKSTMVEVRKR